MDVYVEPFVPARRFVVIGATPVAEALARLARTMRARLLRREQARRRGRRLDIRRTIHRNVSKGGTPVDLVWRRRKTKPLRLVVLLDTSGSMAGRSIRQAREALTLALSRLTPQDRFNVIEFNSYAQALFTEPQPPEQV